MGIVREYRRVLVFFVQEYPGRGNILSAISSGSVPENPFKDARHMSGLAKEGGRHHETESDSETRSLRNGKVCD